MARTRRKNTWRKEWLSEKSCLWSWYVRDHGIKRLKSERWLLRDGCGKSPGFEFYSGRGGGVGDMGFGRSTKIITHRKERRIADRQLRSELAAV